MDKVDECMVLLTHARRLAGVRLCQSAHPINPLVNRRDRRAPTRSQYPSVTANAGIVLISTATPSGSFGSLSSSDTTTGGRHA